mgnify:CR=1 FL=1
MQEVDKIKIYSFTDKLNQKLKIDIKNNTYLDIALIDNFDDKIEIAKL